MPIKILIVDDEPAIREMILFQLGRYGYHCTGASDATEALKTLKQQRPDIILLDWMMPGKSGIELAQEIRHSYHTKNIPIILLTARGDEDDKIIGLNSGVDDYITKPFSYKELSARIKAVLRRASPESVLSAVELDGLKIDPNTHELSVNGGLLSIGPTEFRLLLFLMNHTEKVYTRQQLIDYAWSDDTIIEERTVDAYVRRLRKVLEKSGHHEWIQTVRGVGYRMSTKDE